VALKIIGAEDGVAERIEAAIRGAIPDAQVQVKAGGAAHFELQVVAEAFRGKSMVQQHQLVYGAIAGLMAGDAPPVHAIDRLVTKAP
jgi:acid stress-induced BolA-like protein IbaG/YrbA